MFLLCVDMYIGTLYPIPESGVKYGRQAAILKINYVPLVLS
jgi:hypothetical protein